MRKTQIYCKTLYCMERKRRENYILRVLGVMLSMMLSMMLSAILSVIHSLMQ